MKSSERASDDLVLEEVDGSVSSAMAAADDRSAFLETVGLAEVRSDHKTTGCRIG
jgi:hypothetical protein